MNCEITLFLNKEEDIKSDVIKNTAGNLINSIIKNTLIESKDFNFYLSKTS